NTYLIDGLPPTPIAGVRVSSLRAAAEPAATNYLFFITTDESGKMTFTETFEEFLQIQEDLAGNGS
ncbi:MAG: endolytic transglycosylase MltG, partial [Acidimicrobiia bacterium]